jgi:paraquat-inducible protein B
MSISISPTAVGSFVIGAIVLIVTGVLLFSSGSLFTPTQTAVVVFPGNVKGLSIGSAVQLRGVRIGSVSDIKILSDMKTNKIIVPVYLKFERGILKDMTFKNLSDSISREHFKFEIKTMIEAGLRAQLNMTSLVTGQMMITIDYFPETTANLTNIDPRYPEIPTIETVTDQMLNKLENLPLNELLEKALDLLNHIDQLVSSQDVKDSLSNIKLVTEDAHKLLTHVDAQVEPLSTSTQQTLGDISSLARNVNNQVQPLSDSAISALNEARAALNSINDLLGKDSATRADLENALDELSKAANSIRILTDYLQQHPEALIKGKGY